MPRMTQSFYMVSKVWQHTFWGEILEYGIRTQKAHLWVFCFVPKMAVFRDFGRNFCMCLVGAPTPKVFSAPKVMTIDNIYHK